MTDFEKFKESLNSNTKSNENELDKDNQLKERYTINGVPDVVSETFQKSYTTSPETFQNVLDKGIDINLDRTEIEREEEENNIRKAQQQSALAKIGNSLEQLLVGEVILGSFKGFTDIYDAIIGRLTSDEEYNDYSSEASKFFENLIERNRESFKIYRENPYKAFDISDIGWWADNFVNVGSTLSLLIPSRGIVGIAGKLGKLMKADKWVANAINWGSKLNKAGREGKLANNAIRSNAIGRRVNEAIGVGSTALLSRIAENYQEARGLYNNVHQKIENNLQAMTEEDRELFLQRNPNFRNKSDKEIANMLSSAVADNTFWADMPLVLMDFIQYKSIESFLKDTGKKITTAAIETAQRNSIKTLGMSEAAKAALNAETKGFFSRTANNILNFGKDIIKHPGRVAAALELSEGFEEGWQGIAEQYNEDLIDSYIDPNHTRRTWDSYLTDGHVWEQAVWGAIGGIVFQRVGKGLGKLKTKIQAKNALDKGDITQEQYDTIIRTKDESRLSEINSREDSVQDLITDLVEIEAGRDPRKQEDGSTRNIVDYEDKIKTQNAVVDEWIRNFVLNAVDNGNFDLLIGFIESPEFNKYLNEQNVNSNILNAKSLASRAKDVYDLYTKNIDAILDNTSANDYDSIRKAARWLTRNDMDIISENDNINQLYNVLNQLSGYHPGINYENVRTLDALFNQYKKLIEIYKELDESRKNHTISKSGYNAAKKQTEEYIDAIYKQISDNLTEANLDVDINSFDKYNSIKELDSIISDYRRNTNFAEEWLNTPEQIKTAIDNIIKSKIILADKINSSPTTQEEFEELYNSFETTGKGILNARINRSINRLQNYLLNSENIDIAVQEAMDETFSDVKNPIERKKLKDAMSILKIGSKTYRDVDFLLKLEIDRIKQEREQNKEKHNKAKEDGEVVDNTNELVDGNPETDNSSKGVESESIENKATEPTEKTETKEETNAKEKTESPTTPPVEEINPDEIIFGPEEEIIEDPQKDIEELAKLEKEAYEREQQEGDTSGVDAIGQQFANELTIQTEEDIKRDIKSCLINLGISQKGLLQQMIEDGIGSDAYNKFVKIVTELSIKTGNYRRVEVEPYVENQLKIYLYDLVERKKIPSNLNQGIFKLIEDINKIITREHIDAQFSKIDTISKEDFDKNIEGFLDKYFEIKGIVRYETSNGLKIINIDDIFAKLIKLGEEGVYNFEQLAEIINNIYTFARTYKGQKYIFQSVDLLGSNNYFDNSGTTFAKLNNLSELINKLYLKQTAEKSLIDDNMHFVISNEFGKLSEIDKRNVYSKSLGIEYKTIGGQKTISLYYIDKDGKHKEIGYIGYVNASEDNKTLSLDNPSGIITSVTKENGEVHITTQRLEDILYLLVDNMEEISKKDSSDIIKFSDILKRKYKLDKLKDYNAILTSEELNELVANNKIFKEFLELANIKFAIGEVYTRADGSEGQSKVKITTDILLSMNDSDRSKYTNKILNSLNNILFYPYNTSYAIEHEITPEIDVLRSSLRQYINKIYDNYSETLNYQHALDINKEKELKFDLVATDTMGLNFDKSVNKDISKLGIKGSIESHPFVYVDKDGSIRAEGIDKAYPNKARFKIGAAGILMDVRAGAPMIAIFTEANKVNKELSNAVINEYNKLLEDYYKSSGNDIIDAYNKLYNFFNTTFGKSALFSGWKVISGNNSFTIYRKDEHKNYIKLIEVYKYNASYNKDTGTYNINGQTISNDSLKNHYGHIIKYFTKNAEGKTVVKYISENIKDKDKNLLKEIGEELADKMTYFASAITVDRTINNDFVTINENGITISIGDYTKSYKNYADFLVKNNAFKTTHIGVNKTLTYKEGSNEASSIYVRYTGSKEYISDEEKRRQQGFISNITEKGIKDGDELSYKDFLLDAGYTKESLEPFKELFKVLQPKNITIDLENNKDAYASHKNGKIFVHEKGINSINGDKQEALRILIHENVHSQVEEKGFFTSHKYGAARTEAIIDTWNQFYEVSKNNEDLIEFITNFLNEYGNLRTSEKFEDRALFANEWVAEVLSNPGLINYLNKIDYEGNLIIEQGSNKRTILQKILDILKDLFIDLQNINKNTILDQFQQAIGNPIITYKQSLENSENSNTNTTKITEETSEQTEEEIDTDTDTNEEIKQLTEQIEEDTDTDNFEDNVDLLEDDSDYSIDESIYDDEQYSLFKPIPQNIRINNYLDNTADNPNGLDFAPNMDDWLKGVAPQDRAVLLREMQRGALEYLCR